MSTTYSVSEFHYFSTVLKRHLVYEPGTLFSIPVLGAHLYYRALLTVPSLIHSWVLDCKERQLSSTVIGYTSTHFSPVIIQAELAQAKSAEATSELVDENFTIKVTLSSNEVAAAYAVDDHQLEIRLKIPADWPLHKIEVKDVKRVGVDEHRWRAWILAVQQSIWAHVSRVCLFIIVCVLMVAPLNYRTEGSSMGWVCLKRTLRCILKVRRNARFVIRKSDLSSRNFGLTLLEVLLARSMVVFQRSHARRVGIVSTPGVCTKYVTYRCSCCVLLKFGHVQWFSSSHSSSCPLCRSDII